MKHLAAIALLLSVASATPAQAAKGSAGLVLAYPEIVGAYGSFWPMEDLSLDARITLSTLEAGVTGHILLADNGPAGRHDFLVTAMAGYIHDLVANTAWHTFHGTHVLAMGGYGYQAGWDLRFLAGVSIAQAASAWHTSPAAMIMVGHSF